MFLIFLILETQQIRQILTISGKSKNEITQLFSKIYIPKLWDLSFARRSSLRSADQRWSLGWARWWLCGRNCWKLWGFTCICLDWGCIRACGWCGSVCVGGRVVFTSVTSSTVWRLTWLLDELTWSDPQTDEGRYSFARIAPQKRKNPNNPEKHN